MSEHPLLDLASEREVRQSKEFRKAASTLTGERLAEAFRAEQAAAPRRAEAGKRYLAGQTGRRGRRSARPEPPLSTALVNHCRDTGQGLPLPEGGSLRLLAYQVPLKGGADDRDVGKVDLLGVIEPENRLAVVKLRYLPPDARRGITGDTPLRQLLEGLAATAVVAANRDALTAELVEATGVEPAPLPPALVLLASPRYWEISRRREAQKGAAWISQMERLAKEVEEQLETPVLYLSLELAGEPPWEERDERIVLADVPKLATAWEAGAGRVRPKPKPRPRSQPVDEVVQADPSRPPQQYEQAGSYQPGDTIQHPTLGEGVVQGPSGPGKVKVRFGEENRVLVHERRPRPH